MTTSKPRQYNLFITLLLYFIAATTIPNIVMAAPVVKLDGSGPLSGSPPLSVLFVINSSTCASPCNTHFDFGDGTAQDFPGISGPVHVYTDGGNYTATVTLTDGKGLKGSASVLIQVAVGQTLSSYVNDCKQQLGFSDADVAAIADKLNCTKGVLFAPLALGPQINDYMGYARVTDQVDLAFACRWLNNGTGINPNTAPPFVAAASIEMIMHNRQNGNTCFFEAKPRTMQVPSGTLADAVPVAIVSPTVAAAAAKGTPEANFWYSPLALDNTIQCVTCHVEGPYIATPRIAPFLSQFGLLNNGHETFGRYKDANNNIVGRYHAVGTTLAHFDDIIFSANVPSSSTCADGCHSIGYNGAEIDVFRGVNVLLPSIHSVIDDAGTQQPDISVTTSGAMPPFYDDLSDYRWVNLDTPTNGIPGNGVESENFADAMNRVGNSIVPVLFNGYDPSHPTTPYNPNCSQPGTNVPMQLEAHAVGVPDGFAFSTGTMSLITDRLRTFNLKEGLVCLNSDQDAGSSCHEYSVRYLCSVSNIDGTPTWSGWYNTDSAGGDGDHEERSKHQNICGGVAPIAIQAQVLAGGSAFNVMGPNDRLARFSPYGLTCNNVDQVDGHCSNYVVRYSYCKAPPSVQSNKTLTNIFAVGKQLTAASGSLAKGQSHNGGTGTQWNTQQWNLEPVTNTEYVRVHNVPNNLYLTVTSTAEQATVGTASLNTSTNEMWIVESVSGSSSFRLKNLFSGRYLTIADPKNFPSTPDYLPIYSQGLNTGWTSQQWIVQ